MSRRERPWPCPECGKPTRNKQHEDGSACVVTCPRCGAEVVYNIGGDCLDHPTSASWEACRDVVDGPGIFAQVAP
ncbi:hypothetical protein [Microlunatus antarcticus]|uniref:Endogenous inhibitor of DNA gyrase (YacG/DUF329 family) n=1 Tax=Microlunatus antarcticus TaxID=53388 RepID=A0A7W5JWP7_9ACTN|nr:hypothetical protein [Microlunatus antarcticus]MBB3327476.1 endogenous inhibitor of DNA gyrase (YacG/DUF329 family) [Microlunatus antarcticus]